VYADQSPTSEQLRRLRQVEPYIDYFTGLVYDDVSVPDAYLRALILSESSGDVWAHSVSGARGLTQILPATGRRAVDRLSSSDFTFRYVHRDRLSRFDEDSLYDPALNILIACYLNATYSSMFDGRYELMAAAWNAGPLAVVRNGGRLPDIDQTRRFVARVLDYVAYFEAQQSR